VSVETMPGLKPAGGVDTRRPPRADDPECDRTDVFHLPVGN
jgi:hypothetical protein